MDKVHQLLYQIKKNHIEEYTTSCAYYTILAFIPLIMLILTLTKYVGLEKQSLFLVLSQLMPSNVLNDTIFSIVKEVYAKSVGTITLSLLFTLWSAEKGFLALCKGLNAAYQVKENNSLFKFRIRAFIFTIIFIVLVVLSLILLVFGNRIYLILQENFQIASQFISIVLKIKPIIGVFLLSLVFTFMYRLIPKHGYSLKYHIPGAIVAAVTCIILSVFYGIYIDIFTGFSVVYGSLTTIILAMMWVYGCMYSILLGAIINKIWMENVKSCDKIGDMI